MTSDLRWFKQDDSENFTENCAFCNSYKTANHQIKACAPVIFSHVPKTGGTTLEAILAKNFKPSEILHINAPDLNQLPGLFNLKKNPAKLVCGHHPMHGLLYQLMIESPFFHFTQLRDPIDRVLSYFNYVTGRTNHPMHKHVHGRSLLEFLHANPSPELTNGQCKRFSGYLHQGHTDDQMLFDMAQKTLNECFSLVLTTDLFDEGLLLLKNRLNLQDIYYQRSNVSTKYISRHTLTKEEITTISAANEADTQLFKWAQATCQVLIANELSQHEIDTFKSNNQQWSDLVKR